MKILVVGTGSVGRTLAGALVEQGHDVTVATRSPEETAARDEWRGSPLPLVSMDGAARDAELVVNATAGGSSAEALEKVGLAEGAVVLDVANPLDFSAGFPPTLSVKDTDSLAEQLQREFPQARVVKALNTMTASVMVDPVPGTTAFVAGDDTDAVALVEGVLRSFGWSEVIVFDRLDAARGLEMWLPLWIRLAGRLGTADFNLRIVRREDHPGEESWARKLDRDPDA